MSKAITPLSVRQSAVWSWIRNEYDHIRAVTMFLVSAMSSLHCSGSADWVTGKISAYYLSSKILFWNNGRKKSKKRELANHDSPGNGHYYGDFRHFSKHYVHLCKYNVRRFNCSRPSFTAAVEATGALAGRCCAARLPL